MKNKFTAGQELSFNVYGNEIKGKYVCMLDERTIKIEVTYDNSEVTDIGCTANVNLAFLVKDSNYTKTLKNTQGNIEVSYNTTAHLPYAYVVSNTQESDEEAEANAKLISEAFNVANETGKTPRQLQEENKEFLEVLLEVRKHMTAHIPEKVFDLIDNVINKNKTTL